MFYIYVLKSERDETYIGYTSDLRRRLSEHNSGSNRSTAGRVWRIIYYEAYASQKLARDRERVLKGHGRTKQALLQRLRED